MPSARLWTALVALLLLIKGSHEHQKPHGGSTQELSDSELTNYVLLELSAPAVRYLRAFTVPCWRPAPPLPAAPLDGSWAVALVTLWNDLTAPNNGLGRLVTAQQLHSEAAAMLGEERYADGLAILELSVLLRLFPYQESNMAGQLAPWKRAMALAGAAHPRVRLQLARTLVLVARARAGAGMASVNASGTLHSSSLDLLEGALLASEAAQALFQMEGVGSEEGPADPAQLPRLEQQVVELVASQLNSMPMRDLRALSDDKGVTCNNRNLRRCLLTSLLPALRVPLVLADSQNSRGSVEAAPDPQPLYRYAQWQLAQEWDLYRAVVVDVLTLLPPNLLAEVGIQCGGCAACHCVPGIDSALAAQAGPMDCALSNLRVHQVEDLLGQADMVEEVLWRLEEVLAGTAAGVRMADGTTWLRQPGWNWVVAPVPPPTPAMGGTAEVDLEDKSYDQPGGQGDGSGGGAAASDPAGAAGTVGVAAASQLCLDKTFLLDTVVRLDFEALQGVQYALDNLHYAQLSAGGPDRFWRLAGSRQLDLGLETSQRSQLSQLLSAKYGATAPADLEAILSGSNGEGPGGRDELGMNSKADPFIAAFLSFCVLGAASLYVYGNRHLLSAVLLATPWASGAGQRGGAGSEGAGAGRSMAQRNAATAALREALALGDSRRLSAAIDAAEEAGVEKLLVKKAKTALQALRKKGRSVGKQPQQGSHPRPAAAPHLSSSGYNSELSSPREAPGPPDGRTSRAVHSSMAPTPSAGGPSPVEPLPPPGGLSGSASASGSLPRSLSEGSASLVHAAWEAQRELAAASSASSSASSIAQAGAPGLAKRKAGKAGAAAAPAQPSRPASGHLDTAQQAQQAPAGPKPMSPVRTSAAGGESAFSAPAQPGAQGGAADSSGRQRRGGDLASHTLSRHTSSASEAPISPGTPMETNHSRGSGSASMDPPSPRPPSPPSPVAAAAAAEPPLPSPQTQQQQQRQLSSSGGSGALPSPTQPSPRSGDAASPAPPPPPAAAAAAGDGAAKAGQSARVIVAPRPQRGTNTSPTKKQPLPSPKQPAAPAKPAPAALASASRAAATATAGKAAEAPASQPGAASLRKAPAGTPGAKLAAASAQSTPPASPLAHSTRNMAGKQQPLSPLQPSAAGAVPPPEAVVTFVPADRALTPQKQQQAAPASASPASFAAMAASGSKAAGAGAGAVPGTNASSRFTKRSLSDSACRQSPKQRGGSVGMVTVVQPPPPPPPRRPAGPTSPPGVIPPPPPPPPPASRASLDVSPRSSALAAAAAQAQAQAASPAATLDMGDTHRLHSWPRANPSLPSWTRENRAVASEPYSQQQLAVEPYGGSAACFPGAPTSSGLPLMAGASPEGHSLFEREGAASLTPSRAASLGGSLFEAEGPAGPVAAQQAQQAQQQQAPTQPPARTISMPGGANPELLASLQQIWSGAAAGGGEGGGLGTGAGGNSVGSPAAGAAAAAAALGPSPAASPGPLMRSLSAPRTLRASVDATMMMNPNSPGGSTARLGLGSLSEQTSGQGLAHFDSVLSPAPELAWWLASGGKVGAGGGGVGGVGAGAGVGLPAASAAAGFGGVLAGSWPMAQCGGAGDAGALAAERSLEHLVDEVDESAMARLLDSGADMAMSMDLAELGFTELGD